MLAGLPVETSLLVAGTRAVQRMLAAATVRTGPLSAKATRLGVLVLNSKCRTSPMKSLLTNWTKPLAHAYVHSARTMLKTWAGTL